MLCRSCDAFVASLPVHSFRCQFSAGQGRQQMSDVESLKPEESARDGPCTCNVSAPHFSGGSRETWRDGRQTVEGRSRSRFGNGMAKRGRGRGRGQDEFS